jgi:hypothetical protein
MFEKVVKFKWAYLGAMIAYDNNLDTEILLILLVANRRYHHIKKKSHCISINTKCKLHKTLLRPVQLYGRETLAIKG